MVRQDVLWKVGSVSENGTEIRLRSTDGGVYLTEYSGTRPVIPSAEGIVRGGTALWEQGDGTSPVVLESSRGIHRVVCSVCSGRVTCVTAELGCADFSPRNIPLRFETPLIRDTVFFPDGSSFRLTALRFAEPYAVVFLETAGDLRLLERGEQIARMNLFPEGAEVLFVFAENERNLRIRTVHRDGSNRLRGDDVGAALAAAVAEGRCLPQTSVSASPFRAVYLKDGKIVLSCPVFSETT